MIYQFDSSKVSSYVAKKVMRILLIFVIVFALIFFWLSFNVNPGKSIMPILRNAIPKLGLLFLFMAVVFYYRFLNHYKSICFEVGEHAVAKFMSQENLNTLNKIAIARNERKYGTRENQLIPYLKIASIDINTNRIKIKSVDYSFFNGNGEIEIPKETKDFEKLVEHFQMVKYSLKV